MICSTLGLGNRITGGPISAQWDQRILGRTVKSVSELNFCNCIK